MNIASAGNAVQAAEAVVSPGNERIVEAMNRRYEAGFVTDIATDSLPPGLDEDVVRWISKRKGEPEWMTDWRLAAYRHWLTMHSPEWAKLRIGRHRFPGHQLFRGTQAGSEVAG
jgi:Fe-S cluster assembly protein SufB